MADRTLTKKLVAVTLFVEVNSDTDSKVLNKRIAAGACCVDAATGGGKAVFEVKDSGKHPHCEVLVPGEWHMIYGRIPK